MVSYQDSAVDIETRYTICKGISTMVSRGSAINPASIPAWTMQSLFTLCIISQTPHTMLGCLKKFCWMAKSFGKHILIHLH